MIQFYKNATILEWLDGSALTLSSSHSYAKGQLLETKQNQGRIFSCT